MGRPLKIQKYSAMSGIFVNGPTADATPVNQGYPTWGSLTNTQYAPAGFTDSQFAGVVGGASSTATTAAFPIVRCRAWVPGAAAEGDAQIVTQKGARKFLVIQVASINVTSAVAGQAYRILTVGNTDWAAIGGPANAEVGEIFTATAAGTGTGTVQITGVTVLSNQATGALTQGNMNITYNGSTLRISGLSNKFLTNFAGGMAGGNADTGDVWDAALMQNNARLIANFFVNTGTLVKSGSENLNGSATQPGTDVNLAQVTNYTS